MAGFLHIRYRILPKRAALQEDAWHGLSKEGFVNQVNLRDAKRKLSL